MWVIWVKNGLMTPTNQTKHLNIILGLMFRQLMTRFKHRLVLFYFFFKGKYSSQ